MTDSNVIPLNDTERHECAMTVHSLMSATSKLLSISAEDRGFELLRPEMDDLKRGYNTLAWLLSALQAERVA